MLQTRMPHAFRAACDRESTIIQFAGSSRPGVPQARNEGSRENVKLARIALEFDARAGNAMSETLKKSC
jgi:hypothetical protein